MKAPTAKKIPTELIIHNDLRIDPYYWLRERENPEVIHYLEAENAYVDAMMKDTEPLQEELFQEMKARYKKDDESLPYFFNDYWYIVRYEKGKEYPIFTRKKTKLENPEEIILDVNLLAEGKDFCEVSSVSISPNNLLAAYSEDSLGRRIYEIRIKSLENGQLLEDIIPNTTGKIVWGNDNQSFLYIKKDENLRAYQVWKHTLGQEEDVLIYHEKDEAFDVHISKSKSLEYIFISSSSTISDEHRFISADDLSGEWTVIQPREEDLEYAVEHYGEYFYILANTDDAYNFKMVKTKVTTPSKEYWEEIIPHRAHVLLEGFEIFKNYLVIEEREQGLLQICIIDNQTNEKHYLPFQDPTYTSYIGTNLEFDTELLRYGYTSLTHPNSTMEYNMRTRENKILKTMPVLEEGFSPENLVSKRLWAKSRDGETMIPISVVHHKNTKLTENTPLLLYGYGSYGHTVDAAFSNVRLSLLNRGFVYAIAHIRGGEYLGREWYEEGKMLLKKNTFFDFIDAAQYLIHEKMTSSNKLYAMGGSAGGLLIGAVVNYEPELFHGVIAQVPFVDVVTTMLDESIPLTTGEYDEWGNPNEEEYYHYMKSYSPYDNVERKAYPHMLITTGFHDSQVQYWEPAKWVAKLRELKTDDHLLLFKTDMTSGHGGASGRFESLKEDALEYAFLIRLARNESCTMYNDFRSEK